MKRIVDSTSRTALLKDISVLYVEDEPAGHRRVLQMLQPLFKEIHCAFDGQKGLELFQQYKPDVVLTDDHMPLMGGPDMARRIKEISPDTPIIMFSADYETDLLLKAIDIGVDKFERKPIDKEKLLAAVYKSVLPRVQEKEIQTLNQKIAGSLEARVSQSPAMKEAIQRIEKVADSDFSVIIHGETGVGKSYVAGVIHDLSRRADKPFITVDIGAIPETLVESELFGHTRGAFTGADKSTKGFFEIAHGGALFLEELENMTPYVQSKLLRAVEEKRIFPVGSTTPVEVDIRIISATNTDIFAEVKNGTFREDLFYRLREFDIHIPPLRDRPEDVPMLAEKFVRAVAKELDKNIIEISEGALKLLQEQPWKGNIREMKNLIRRAVLLCDGDRLTPDDIARIVRIDREHRHTGPAHQAIGFSLSAAVASAEKLTIQRALQKTGGKKVKTAELLEIDYKTLMTKMKKYGIPSPG